LGIISGTGIEEDANRLCSMVEKDLREFLIHAKLLEIQEEIP